MNPELRRVYRLTHLFSLQIWLIEYTYIKFDQALTTMQIKQARQLRALAWKSTVTLLYFISLQC